VAISGTHDTETLAEWWDNAPTEERHLCAEIPGLREAGCDPDALFGPRTRDALLRALFSAGSNFVIVPFQDFFGWRGRVNVPALVNDDNWTWRLPWPIDDLDVRPETQERAAFLRALATEYGRQGGRA
jgi:4-alpha-glucanotransferase